MKSEKEAGDIGLKRERSSSLIKDNGTGDAWGWKDSQCYKIILDIDEGEKKRCGTNATCANTGGSFRCPCNIGYYGDGYNCTGIPVFYSVFSTEILWSLTFPRSSDCGRGAMPWFTTIISHKQWWVGPPY